MTVRIPMSPDVDGVIRLSCGGQDLEIVVKGWTGSPQDARPGDPPGGSPPDDFTSPRASRGEWDPFNPIDRPGIFMRIDDLPDLDIDGLIDGLGLNPGDKHQITFLADKSVNFHQLCQLGESLQHSDIAGFAVAFRAFDRDEE